MTIQKTLVKDRIPNIEDYIVECDRDLNEIYIDSKIKAIFKCKCNECNNTIKTTFNQYCLKEDNLCDEHKKFVFNSKRPNMSLASWFIPICNTTNHMCNFGLPMSTESLSGISKNSKKYIKFMCNNGHKFETSPYNITHNKSWCPICSGSRVISKAELCIYYYFVDAIDVEQQRKCKFNTKRTYDIYFPKYRVAVEFDGAKWHKNLMRDIEKHKLAEREGIELLRIKETDNSTNGQGITCKELKEFINNHIEYECYTKNWCILPYIVTKSKNLDYALTFISNKIGPHVHKTSEIAWNEMLADFYLGVKANNFYSRLILMQDEDKFDHEHNSIKPERIRAKEKEFKVMMICSKCKSIYSITPYDFCYNNKRHECIET